MSLDLAAAPSAATPPWILRRARPADAPAFARMMAEPEVFSNVLQLPHPDAALWEQRLADSGAPGRADLHLAAVVEGEVIGSAGLHTAAPMLRRRHAVGLGITVARSWQGRGVGSALMSALCDYADQWAGILRIELTVFTDNTRAVALYQRFGFEIEGTLRAYALRHGHYEDVYTMARLHPHPPAWSPKAGA
jgi:putative acetyltransferase